jgi:glycerophosphoryl diester phosphodiesterase
LTDPSIVEKSQKEDIDIVAWTVDNREDFEELVKIGVNRITTNSLLVRKVLIV